MKKIAKITGLSLAGLLAYNAICYVGTNEQLRLEEKARGNNGASELASRIINNEFTNPLEHILGYGRKKAAENYPKAEELNYKTPFGDEGRRTYVINRGKIDTRDIALSFLKR